MTMAQARDLTPSECLERLATCSMGSVALSRGALPVIEPVRYQLLGGVVVLAAMAEGVLGDAVGEVITLGVHDLEPLDGERWAVNVTGYAAPVAPADPAVRSDWWRRAARVDPSSVVLSIALISGSRLLA